MNDNGKLRVVLATHNAGKIRELADPMADFGIEVVGLSLFPEIGEIEETGTTFEENALIKARAVCAATGLVAVADDSGLEVDALDKGPGVYSARYSNDWESLPGESVDQRNMRKLLFELRDVPQARRSCRFVSCMVAVHPGGRELVVRGTCHYTANILEIGVMEKVIDGFQVKVYDVERCVCDAVKFRNKVGIDVCSEIIDNYLSRPERNISKLMDYARQLRVGNILENYLQVKL